MHEYSLCVRSSSCGPVRLVWTPAQAKDLIRDTFGQPIPASEPFRVTFVVRTLLLCSLALISFRSDGGVSLRGYELRDTELASLGSFAARLFESSRG